MPIHGEGLKMELRGSCLAVVLSLALLSACADEVQKAVPVPAPDMPVIPEPVDCEEGGVFVSPAPLRLLTRFEYDNTVRDLIGQDLRLAQGFPPENRVGIFENDSQSHVVSPLLVQKYLGASEDIADAAMTDQERIVPCDPVEVGEAECGRAFVYHFGGRAFRRPLTDPEASIFVGLFEGALERDGFDGAIKLVIQATLQSPQFLYRVEALEEDQPDAGEMQRVEGYEMASRLSYFIWSSMPDETLLDKAAQGQLTTRAQIEEQARRMIADGKATDTVKNFHRQWLSLESIGSLTKDQTEFEQYTNALKGDWVLSFEAFLDHLFVGTEPTVENLLTDPTVFLTPAMAEIHGVELAEDALVEPWLAPEGQRAGILTQPALMALLANPDQSSPIFRGIFVRERILCQEMPPPPANLEITPPDPAPNATTRERFAEHTANAQCAGCHVLIDPIGFGFEKYDALGRWREFENGLGIDATGEMTNVGKDPVEGPFDGAVELSEKMVDSPLVKECIAEQWWTYANGRLPGGFDVCALDELRADFGQGEGDLRELMVSIVLSDPFLYRVTQGQQEEAP
jgi:hypothetical protein